MFTQALHFPGAPGRSKFWMIETTSNGTNNDSKDEIDIDGVGADYGPDDPCYHCECGCGCCW